MITINGTQNTAKCFCNELEERAEQQISSVCDQEAFKDCKIRIMPDVHAGKGCTIGTTMTVTDKIVPGMVGVDIGCGMETVKLATRGVKMKDLDDFIHSAIPSGREIRRELHPLAEQIDLSGLRCIRHVNVGRALRSIGTLGGGNHFIEVDQNKKGELYLVVHSGSRHLGTEVATYYQEQGLAALRGSAHYQIEEMIRQMREEGRHREIQTAIDLLKEERDVGLPEELAYVEGYLFDSYIHDMKLVQEFAALNRKAMIETILQGLGLAGAEQFTTVHNYVDTDSMILRKGAVSAKLGEKLLIPINMRDGALICVGKGNGDWNCSAPHGAGRLMSRKTARNSLSLEQYRAEMKGVYTTCVRTETLDESPMAYKRIEDILEAITPTAEVLERITPVYNFKAAD